MAGSWVRDTATKQPSGFGRTMLTLLVVAPMLLMAGCGFRPVYGTLGRDNADQASAEAMFAQVHIPPIPERDGQILRNLLIDRIYVDGVPAAPRYDLNVGIRDHEMVIDIDRDDSVTRTQLTMTAQASLIDRDNGKTVWTADSRATTDYNVLDSPFATVMARKTAREQALRQIGDDLVIRLGAFFAAGRAQTGQTSANPD